MSGSEQSSTAIIDTEQQPQRQDSLADQLRDLLLLANRFGMWDAADWLLRQMNETHDRCTCFGGEERLCRLHSGSQDSP